MKYKLPLLLLLSLVWQAAASADEWTNIATAVTVTEGYLCAGEAALDGTGTDVKCDDSNPYIDDDGNIGIGTVTPSNSLTVVGDISATTLNATQLCDEDGSNCTDLSDGLSGVSSLASLTDVSVSTPVSGSYLTWNGSEWESTELVISSCPEGYAFLGGSCYKNYDLAYTYANARNTCLADGADLAVINDSSEETLVRDYRNTSRFWIGYNDISLEGTFEWVDGSSTGYSNWRSGEPNNSGGNEDCTEVVLVNGGTWNDSQCSNNYYFICEKNPSQSNVGVTRLVSLTDVSASSPTDGQLLSYDASENEWVATDVISKTIIYNSIDDNPCVVTGGVRKLSFNPTTGRLRVCRP